MNTNLYLTAFRTIVIKEVNRFARIWIQTILPPAVSMTLYFVIFGSLIGPRIGTMSGFSYIQYIAPGIIMMSIINSSYANVVSSFFGAKFQRHIEEMLVAPIPNIIILSGYITGGVARGMMVGLVVTLVALFFTELHIEHPLIVVTVVLLTSTLFPWQGLLMAYSPENLTTLPLFHPLYSPRSFTWAVSSTPSICCLNSGKRFRNSIPSSIWSMHFVMACWGYRILTSSLHLQSY